MELNCQRTMEARERPNSKLEVKKALAGTTTTLFGSQPRTRGFGGVIRLAGVVRSWPSSTGPSSWANFPCGTPCWWFFSLLLLLLLCSFISWLNKPFCDRVSVFRFVVGV